MRIVAILALLLLGAWADNLPAAAPRLRTADIRMLERENLIVYRGDDYFFRDQKAFADQSGGELLKGGMTTTADQIYTGRKAAFECVIVFDQTGMARIASFGMLPDGYSAVVCQSVHQMAAWQVLVPTRTLGDIRKFQSNQRVDSLGLHKSLLLLTQTDRAGLLVPQMYFRVVAWAPLGRPLNWDAQYRDAGMFARLGIAMARAAGY
jgi:hypothetical protein